MLINLSNHPSCKWSEKQLFAAKQYGEIVDISFPVVDPACGTPRVQKFAEELIDTIRDFGSPAEVVIHIMGEMTLTFLVVKRLKEMGYTCLASTSYREIIEEEFNKKIVIFTFVRFREY